MNNIELGKRLKEARLTKKMTQSDVVGTFITRNMLSQIESGAANPSLRTLEYLANTLELPIHYLIAENIEDTASANQGGSPAADLGVWGEAPLQRTPELYGLVLSLKALYDTEQYDKLGELLNELLDMAKLNPPS